MQEKYISLVSDTTFKYLFKNEKTKSWLIEIILNKTGINLKEYVLVDNEDNTGNHVKDYRMDLVFSKDNNIVIIEMNKYYSKAAEIKGRQYLYRKASHGFDTGEEFKDEPNVKLIMFNNYYHKQKDIKLINYYLFNKEYKLKYDDIEIYEIYLPTYKQICYDKCNEMDKRLWLFTANNFEEMKTNVKEEETLQIIKELERLSMNDKFIDEYDYENVQRKLINSAKSEGYEDGVKDGFNEGVEKGLEKGVKQGIKQGIQEEKIKIAKELLSKGADINLISEVTELTIDDINLLKNNYDNI